MKGKAIILVTGLFILLNGGDLYALTIGFSPSFKAATVGDSVEIGLIISGLGDASPDSLSTFDLDVTFDGSILIFDKVVFGDPLLGDQLDLFAFGSLTSYEQTGLGSLNLFELSFDLPSDLDLLQAGSFSPATLTFQALGIGSSPLGLTVNTLGDAFALPLFPDVLNEGTVTVAAPIPEPGTMILLGCGLLGLAWFSRKKGRLA